MPKLKIISNSRIHFIENYTLDWLDHLLSQQCTA